MSADHVNASQHPGSTDMPPRILVTVIRAPVIAIVFMQELVILVIPVLVDGVGQVLNAQTMSRICAALRPAAIPIIVGEAVKQAKPTLLPPPAARHTMAGKKQLSTPKAHHLALALKNGEHVKAVEGVQAEGHATSHPVPVHAHQESIGIRPRVNVITTTLGMKPLSVNLQVMLLVPRRFQTLRPPAMVTIVPAMPRPKPAPGQGQSAAKHTQFAEVGVVVHGVVIVVVETAGSGTASTLPLLSLTRKLLIVTTVAILNPAQGGSVVP